MHDAHDSTTQTTPEMHFTKAGQILSSEKKKLHNYDTYCVSLRGFVNSDGLQLCLYWIVS